MKPNGLRIAIVGVGLIGGSLGMAARRLPEVERVIGIARRAETLSQAEALGAIDEGTLDARAGVSSADVVVLCPPVRSVVPVLSELAPALPPGAIVTDVGSTKGEICAAARDVMPEGCVFIGGHPMAGSEQAGVAAADPYLFQNAIYALTPDRAWLGGDPDAADAALRNDRPSGRPELDLLWRLAAGVGARPLILDARIHDRIVAAVSHLPHVVAASLVQAVGALAEGESRTLQLAAGGFRDTTRIASGPADIWRDICLMNQEALLSCLDAFEEALGTFRRQITRGDDPALETNFAEAAERRAQIPRGAKGIIRPLFELVLQLEDRPGVIADVTTLIAQAGINLTDIEILRVREGEGGTVRLGFETAEMAGRAREILRQKGHVIRR